MIITNSYGNDLNPEINFYKSILSELSTVVDVGCRCDNIFYDINPNLEIHLFEPMISDDIIKFKESLDKLPKVRFNNYGLSSKKETKEFFIEYASLSTDWHKYLNRGKETIKLEFDTLYNYINNNKIYKIDLLKIDTEAWDFEVMKGAKDKIYDITYIQFEAGWPIYGESDTMQDIFNYFKEYNFYNIGGSPENYIITKKTLNLPRIK